MTWLAWVGAVATVAATLKALDSGRPERTAAWMLAATGCAALAWWAGCPWWGVGVAILAGALAWIPVSVLIGDVTIQPAGGGQAGTVGAGAGKPSRN